MTEQEKIEKETPEDSRQALELIYNATCNIDVFSLFIGNIRNGDSIETAVTGALCEWDEL